MIRTALLAAATLAALASAAREGKMMAVSANNFILPCLQRSLSENSQNISNFVVTVHAFLYPHYMFDKRHLPNKTVVKPFTFSVLLEANSLSSSVMAQVFSPEEERSPGIS